MIKAKLDIGKLQTGSHSKFDLKARILWAPKYRKRVLEGAVGERVREVLKELSHTQSIRILSGKVAPDYVSLVVSYPPKLALSKAIQNLKGGSSRILLQEFPHLKQQFWGQHFWARGYLAVSIGQIDGRSMAEYIDSVGAVES